MAFVSDAQRKAVMSKLREEGFAQKPIKITKEANFYRARIEEPSKFQRKSFRTMDIGRKGHTRIIIAKPISKKTTRTQSILIPIRR